MNKRILFLSLFLISTLCFATYVFCVRVGYFPSINYFLGDPSEALNTSYFSKHKPPAEENYLNYNKSLDELIENNISAKNKISLLIEKSKRRLTLYNSEIPLKSYPIVLGSDPVKDKFSEGDRRTPEGFFSISCKYVHSNWLRFLCLNYPNRNSWEKHFKAKFKGQIPLFSRVGSEVGIHGTPEGMDKLITERRNWTWGCISLKRKDIDEIYNFVEEGAEVEIIH